MGSLNVDTNKLRESGQDIIDLTRELSEEFEALFSRITNMSTRTLEWVGPSSEQFIKRTNMEKIQYTKIVQTLNKYGKMLTEVATQYDLVTKK